MIVLPNFVTRALDILCEAGYDAFVVGGCVRDALLGLPVKDYDICTNALPEQTAACFAARGLKALPTGLKYGTVTVLIGKHTSEITTFRRDGGYADHRRPESVSFTGALRDDLSRRDFTINAMAWHPQSGLMDFFGGLDDINNRVLRCVGIAAERFEEDALRIMRLFRFYARLPGFAISPQTLEAAREKAPLLDCIAKERIYHELLGILCCGADGAADALHAMLDCAVMQYVLPPLHSAQNRLCRVEAVRHLPGVETVRLAALLGGDRQAARDALRALRCENKLLDEVLLLIEWRNREFPAEPAGIRGALGALGTPLYLRLLELLRACAIADRDDKGLERISLLKALSDEVIAAKPCVRLSELAVDGSDIMALGVPAGKQVGRLLHLLLEVVLLDPSANNRECLLKLAGSEMRST